MSRPVGVTGLMALANRTGQGGGGLGAICGCSGGRRCDVTGLAAPAAEAAESEA